MALRLAWRLRRVRPILACKFVTASRGSTNRRGIEPPDQFLSLFISDTFCQQLVHYMRVPPIRNISARN